MPTAGTVSPDPVGPTTATDAIIDTALPALQWARVYTLFKTHGLLTAVLVLMAWQIGMIANAQDFMCGV